MDSSSSSQPDFDYLFQLLLIGDSGVIKSIRLLRFTADSFKDVSPTIGFFPYPLFLPSRISRHPNRFFFFRRRLQGQDGEHCRQEAQARHLEHRYGNANLPPPHSIFCLASGTMESSDCCLLEPCKTNHPPTESIQHSCQLPMEIGHKPRVYSFYWLVFVT